MHSNLRKALCLAAVLACVTGTSLWSQSSGAKGVGRSAIQTTSTPIANLQPQGLIFFQQVGQASFAQPVRLFNAGTAPLTGIHLKISGPFVLGNNCRATLPAGGICVIQVQFNPSASELGVQTGTLTATDNSSNSPQTVSLTGTGIASSILLNPPGGLSFGTVALGKSGTSTVELTNPSAASLTVSNISVTGDFTEANNCTSAPVVGQSCYITITFKPSGAGNRNGILKLTDSGSDSPQSYSLSGVGASSAISLSTGGLQFPAENVGTTSAVKKFSITNTGASAISILNIVAAGDFAQTNNCGSALAGGANCVVSVTFAPSATGTRKGYVTISDTDPTNLQTITLQGTGQVPASTVAVSPRQPSVTFTQTEQFSATVNGSPSTDVSWSVDGIPGGNSTVGTISASGLYAPPAAGGTHSITATSNADSSQSATVPLLVTNYAGTVTYHNDLARTGQNLNETVLTTGNVNGTQFGKLFSYPVDGQIYSQTLYLPNVNIPNQGAHNVVYVTTEHDTVYAFDADGRTSTPLWQDSFANPGAGINTIPTSLFTCGSLHPEVGITGTPVIDPARGALYVVVRTAETSNSVTTYVERLHALDVTSGAELNNSPVVLQPSVAGSGFGNDGKGNIPFDPLKENQRAGLVLLNGSLYIAWGGLCDNNPYHGWLVQYDPVSLQQMAVFNTTPNDWGAPIWQSGSAPPADAEGNLYFITGNGDSDLYLGGTEFGDSFVKVSSTGGTISLSDYFTPYNQSMLYHFDMDLGSGGSMVLPDQPTSPTHLLVGGGKEGTIYLINRDNMGHYNTNSFDNSQIVQSLIHATGQLTNVGNDAGLWTMPAYFQNQIYYVGVGDVPKAYRLFDSQLSLFPVSQGAARFNYPGGEMAISANGSTNGIAWTVAEPLTKNAVLYAYDAANLSHLLYNSAAQGSRDSTGTSTQFQVPTIANGKVYVGTGTELDVFGLLP